MQEVQGVVRSAAPSRGRATSRGYSYLTDLDGDGVLTREEYAQALRWTVVYELRGFGGLNRGNSAEPAVALVDANVRRLTDILFTADLDGDGRITFPEMLADAARNEAKRPRVSDDATERAVLSTLDADGDGVVTWAQFEAAGRRAFDAADLDHDGRLSEGELRALLTRRGDFARLKELDDIDAQRSAEGAARHAACGLPLPSARAKVALVGVREAANLSTAGFGAKLDAARVVDLVVEPGPEPLFIVAASEEPVIWRVRGATGRIERMVTAGRGKDKSHAPDAVDRSRLLVGVVGLPGSKLAFPREVQCTSTT